MKKMSKKDLNRWIGSQIYKKRTELKMSQEALSEAVDVSRIFISNLENGNCAAKIDTYYRIAHVFDISLCDLFRDDGDDSTIEELLFLFNDCSPKETRALIEILRVSKKQIQFLQERNP